MSELLWWRIFLAMSRETIAWVKCVSYRIRGRASETDYQAGPWYHRLITCNQDAIFQCNICGTLCTVELASLARELNHVLIATPAHALVLSFEPCRLSLSENLILSEFPIRKDIKAWDWTDARLRVTAKAKIRLCKHVFSSGTASRYSL